MKPKFMQKLMTKVAGMVDSPLLTGISLQTELHRLNIKWATLENIAHLTTEQKSKAVIFVQDAFTSYFETPVVLDSLKVLQALGFTPLVAPFKPNGKPLQVHGFLKAFAKAADTNATLLNGLASSGIPLIGLDPAMTLAYRGEYQKLLGENAPKVQLVQEWLVAQKEHLISKQDLFRSGDYSLLAHCTEKTNAVSSVKDWQTVFSQLGQTLNVIETGCCGMSGTFGHEAVNVETSKKIYQLSWSNVVNNPTNFGKLTATGYSCRSQTKRIDKVTLPHPLQILLAQHK
jgi:Fe-S oxidoreductase